MTISRPREIRAGSVCDGLSRPSLALPALMLITLGVLGGAALFVRADPPSTGTVLRAIYFGPAGPVRIIFHITIDGRPVDAVWAEALDGLFTFCDTNGNGVLDATERAVFAPPRRMRAANLPPNNVGSPLQLAFDAKGEGVTRAAFAAGYGPTSLKIIAGRPDSQQLSAALFRHLDRDGDGRLSPDELKAARDRLAVLDANEDELLSADELLGRAVSTTVPSQPAPGMAEEEPAADSPDLVV